MSIIKGVPGDISQEFLTKIDRAFPESSVRWAQGKDIGDLAKATGHREVIDWIKRAANVAGNS